MKKYQILYDPEKVQRTTSYAFLANENTVELHPGKNSVDADKWDFLKNNPATKRDIEWQIEMGVIRVTEEIDANASKTDTSKTDTPKTATTLTTPADGQTQASRGANKTTGSK